jgi:hypothetical protein
MSGTMKRIRGQNRSRIPVRPHSAMRMSMPLIASAFLAILVAGCSGVKPLGGSYYLKTVYAPPNILSEPGGGSLHLLHKRGLRRIEISDRVGAFNTSIHRDFNWRVYGRNLAFVEYDTGPPQLSFRLFIYSEQHGRVLVDSDFSRYWKVIADETGIICHRYQSGYERDDPTPIVYTTQYLCGL